MGMGKKWKDIEKKLAEGGSSLRLCRLLLRLPRLPFVNPGERRAVCFGRCKLTCSPITWQEARHDWLISLCMQHDTRLQFDWSGGPSLGSRRLPCPIQQCSSLLGPIFPPEQDRALTGTRQILTQTNLDRRIDAEARKAWRTDLHASRG